MNYGFSHREKILIANIIRLDGKKINPYNAFKALLPPIEILAWLNFILALAKILSINEENITFAFANDTLYLYNEDKELDLPIDELRKISKPTTIALAINQKP